MAEMRLPAQNRRKLGCWKAAKRGGDEGAEDDEVRVSDAKVDYLTVVAFCV